MPDPHGAEANVDIGKAYPEETHPGPKLVLRVQASDAIVKFVPRRIFGYTVETASGVLAARCQEMLQAFFRRKRAAAIAPDHGSTNDDGRE